MFWKSSDCAVKLSANDLNELVNFTSFSKGTNIFFESSSVSLYVFPVLFQVYYP